MAGGRPINPLGDSMGPVTADLRIGSYRLLQPLGKGGMSSVYRAVHVGTGHEVAVKVLPRALAKDEVSLQRFLREAKNAESLEHPNIASIYDHGVDDGRHYLVLELVEGGDFQERVRLGGPLGFAEAVAVVRAVAEGLRHAASRGVIHRDIKPANLLMSPGGEVKIIDLGLSLQAEDEDERVTRHGTTVGTVDYMAPEQARNSRATSEQSDIYSLGATLYFLVAGSPPFPGGDISSKLHRHVFDPPPDPRSLRPETPEGLVRVIERMMAKRPEQRYDYDELIGALDAGPHLPPQPLSPLVDEGPDAAVADVLPFLDGPGTPALTDDFLAGLASSDSDDDRPPRAVLPTVPAPPEADQTPIPLSEVPEDDGPPASLDPATRHPSSISARTWIVSCALLGLTLVLFVIGLDQLIRATSGVSDETTTRSPETTPLPAPAIAVDAAPSRPIPTAKGAPATPRATTPMAWTEPVDPVLPSVPETSYGPAVEARFVPEWAREEVPVRLDGPFVTVRRIPAPEDPDAVPTLRRALDVRGGTVEIADDGPFVEDDLRVAGESRLIRARAGYRPIVRVEEPKIDFLKGRGITAVFILDGKRLILDGLDLIVNVPDLPLDRTALFLCKGADLTLRNCTITILNPAGRPFTLLRTAPPEGPSDRVSRIRLDGTFVRGASRSAFDLSGGAAEIAVTRSVLILDAGPLIACQPAGTTGVRRFHIIRSLLACRGPILEIAGSATTARPDSVVVRALGTTFARIEEASASSLIVSQERRPEPGGHLSWLGDANRFSGWGSWLSSGEGRTVEVANLGAARVAWPATDPQSVESATAWPGSLVPAWVVPGDLEEVSPERRATLARVAAPSPYLREKTVETFDPLAIPGRAGDPALPAPVSELTFDVAANPWMGDLGLFLRERMSGLGERVRVRVKGTGSYACSPIRMPAGASLEIRAEPAPSADGPSLVWSPRGSAAGEALIDVHGGTLILSNVGLMRDGGSRLKHLIRVEDGHLVVYRCRLLSRGAVETGGGGLVAFRAATSRPLQDVPGPFGVASDIPSCRLIDSVLITGGDALSAEVARGVVALEHCALAAGGDALTLLPGRVAKGRFQADLWLDRCTLVAGRSVVALGPWPGGGPGPDRPWLVSTQGTAFLDGSNRIPREGALLRVEPDTFARGGLFWHAYNDAYEVGRFIAGTDNPPAPDVRPNVRQQWVDLWGSNHIRGVSGPSLASRTPGVRTLERLRPGDIGPGDLVLDPSFHPGRKALDVGADPRRLGLPTVRSPRRR